MDIPGALDWGFTFNATVQPEIQFGLTYRRTDTQLALVEGLGSREELFDMSVHHFLGGFMIEFQEGQRMRPFIDLAWAPSTTARKTARCRARPVWR